LTRPRFLPRPGQRSADHQVRLAVQMAGRLLGRAALLAAAVLASMAIAVVDQVLR
jgi:hypothetical protein